MSSKKHTMTMAHGGHAENIPLYGTHIYTWSLTSDRILFSAYIRVRNFTQDGAQILREASNRLIHRFDVCFLTVHIEEECLSGKENAAAIDITT